MRRSSGLLLTVASALLLLASGLQGWAITVGQFDVMVMGANPLPNNAVCVWWYGCSPTSAGMMMGFYDRNGYQGNNYNLVPGGAESQNNLGPNLNDAIASSGHIADFFSGGINAYNDDVNPPTHSFDCLADFMGTSQDNIPYGPNVNGGTMFWHYSNGAKTYAEDLWAAGYGEADGMCGVEQYVNYAGYQCVDRGIYSQWTDNYMPGVGFTFAEFKAEIDAGRCVLVNMANFSTMLGHSVYGYGYDDATQSILIYNTWDYASHTMAWGGDFAGDPYAMKMYGVMVMEITGGTPIGTPDAGCTLMLLGSALTALAVIRRKLN